MRYLLSKEFTKISETSGTIQNASNIRTLEMSTFAVPNSGIFIAPLQTHTFTDTTIYLRCVDGWAQACVVPFVVDGGNSSGSSDTSSDSSNYDEVTGDIWGDNENYDNPVEDMWSSGNSTSPYDSDFDQELDNIFNS